MLLVIFFFQKKKQRNNAYIPINERADDENLKKRLNELTLNYQNLLHKKINNDKGLVELFKLINYKNEFNENILFQQARQIILETIDNNVLNVVNETSTASIKIDEEIKAKFIGVKGKNMDWFKTVTKTNAKIEPNQPFITISSTNSIRRHLAICTLRHMIKSKAFDQKAISNIFKKEQKNQEKSFYHIGKDYIVNKLKFHEINPKVYEHVGRLQYRTSYSQNVLEHCYECAILAEKMAHQLSLDPYRAKISAFFHDLGKSRDQEDGSYNHIKDGEEIAKECNLPSYVIEVLKLINEKINQANKKYKAPHNTEQVAKVPVIIK